MSTIPRFFAIPNITPYHREVVAPGQRFWFVSRPDSLATMQGYATASVEVTAGAEAASPYADPTVYALPTHNGDTNQVSIFIPHDEDAYLSSLLDLETLPIGGEIIFADTIQWGNQQTNTGFIWQYGFNDADASGYALRFSASERPHAEIRCVTASTQSADTTPTMVGGDLDTTDAAWLDTLVHCVSSWKRTGALEMTVRIHCDNGTNDCIFEDVIDLNVNGATALPYNTGDENHLGLRLCARNASGGTAAGWWGYGSGNNSKRGNLAIARFDVAVAGRVADVVAELLAKPYEFPASLIEEE